MAKNAAFNSWFNGMTLRSRKKKVVGEGKDFQKGDAINGARAAYGMSGRAAQRAAYDKDRETDFDYVINKVRQSRNKK